MEENLWVRILITNGALGMISMVFFCGTVYDSEYSLRMRMGIHDELTN